MELHFNVSGEDRKRLVGIISQHLDTKAKYMGMPTASYQIGIYNVSKDGTLTFPEDADLSGSSDLIDACVMAGFAPSDWEAEQNGETADEGTEGAETADRADTGLTIELPLDYNAVANLEKLLDAKGSLIKAALGIEALPIEVRETTVAFPWFLEIPEPDEAKAYTELVAALYKLAKEAKRVTAKDKEVDNPKYAFRCFLLRLGFIGDEYKKSRKILLKRLSGSSAFRDGKKGGDQ